MTVMITESVFLQNNTRQTQSKTSTLIFSAFINMLKYVKACVKTY